MPSIADMLSKGVGMATKPNLASILKNTAMGIKEYGAPAAYTAVAGGALAGLGAAAHHQVQIASTEHNLIKKNPDLANYDADKIRDYMEVIKTYSPQAARNPLVAGALVKKMIDFGGVDHKLVQDLASLQSSMKSPFGDHLTAIMNYKGNLGAQPVVGTQDIH